MNTAGPALDQPTSDTEFVAVFNRLAVALQVQPDERGITQGVYFEVLRDLPLAALEASVEALMCERGRKYFPSTPEWREAAEHAHGAQLRAALRPARDEPWQVECEACDDTGWQVRSCEGLPESLCGRVKVHHAAHDYVEVCPCRAMNRTFQGHQFRR